jgi:hypothetical protein
MEVNMRFALISLIAVATVTAACSKSSPTGPGSTPQGLVGTWNATRAEFVSSANSSLRTEVVAQRTTVVLIFASAGTYTFTMTDPGQAPNATNGTWSASTDVLTLKQTGRSGDTKFDMTQSGNNLTLNGGHVQFDFGADGSVEEALLNMTLVRQ